MGMMARGKSLRDSCESVYYKMVILLNGKKAESFDEKRIGFLKILICNCGNEKGDKLVMN